MPQATDLVTEVTRAAASHGQKNIIVLSGPPATGKSHNAWDAAMQIAGHERFIKQVQFHPNFTYDGLMEGFRPTPSGGFQPERGALVLWSDTAAQDTNQNQKYVLIIEELSRANIPAVLGELMTYLEHRDRSVWLPITGRDFRVAKNLVIIATMNPRDRSALELDDAVYRRLRVIDCPPQPDLIDSVLPRDFEPAGRRVNLVNALKEIFLRCERDFPGQYETDMPFGHAEFASVHNESDLSDLWEQQLRYLLNRPGLAPHPFLEVIQESFGQALASLVPPAPSAPAPDPSAGSIDATEGSPEAVVAGESPATAVSEVSAEES